MSGLPLNHLRHDTADLFRLRLLADQPWAMTPCIVQQEAEWRSIRHPDLLLHLPDDTEVLCPWPGKARTDVFRFTVGEFRKAHEEAGGEPSEAPKIYTVEGSFNWYLHRSGDFVKAIAVAIQRADPVNQATLALAFPQMVAAFEYHLWDEAPADFDPHYQARRKAVAT